MNNLWTVTGFTFKNKFKSKAFLITSLVLVVLLTIGMHLPVIIQWFDTDKTDFVGMTETESDVAAMVDQYFTTLEDGSIEIVWLENRGSSEENFAVAKEKIEAGEIKAYLQMDGEYIEGVFPTAKLYTEKSTNQSLLMSLQGALDATKTSLIVNEIGLAEQDLLRLNTPAELEADTISPTRDDMSTSELVMAYVLVYALTILIFFAVVMYGNLISSEITAEKSSRVMEILVSSVSPLSQMFGKILGMFLLAMLQIGVFFIVIAVNLLLPYNREILSVLDISLSDLNISLLFYFLLFYVLGYLIYATVFAAIGSIVSRTEDLGQALTPVTFISLAGFYISLFGMNAPDSTIVIVTSYIPFFTPFVMFLRLGLGDPAWWEVWLSIGLLSLSILLLGWLAAKIYRTGVLMYGKRPSIKELRKAMKSYKV